LDLTTGLYYYGYRWYDPETGRWPSRDPIGEGIIIDFNLYAFAANRSSYRIDLLGLRTEVSFEKYWDSYHKKYPAMNDHQIRWAQKMLRRGCVGITCINLGDDPEAKNCFTSLELAKEKQESMKKGKCCPQIYSIHYYNNTGKNKRYPDSKLKNDGKEVDMSNWDKESRPGKNKEGNGWVNFDYGFLNPDGTITHADMYHNPDVDGDGKGDNYRKLPIREGTIYISSIEEWKKSYDDFNSEVWCVQCIGGKAGRNPDKEWRNPENQQKH
jgi:RHS repeat-associated protein